MKTLKFNLLMVATLILFLQASAGKEEFSKKMSKSFDVDKGASLILKNKFGKIHCVDWDKNAIDVEVKITVNASSQEKADKIFAKINVEISGSSSKVEVITHFDDNFSNNENNEFSVDFNISMPAWINLDVDHKFGDLTIGVVTGKSKIDLAYGNIDARRFEGDNNDIEIKFSDGKIGYISNAELDLKYSDIDIDEAGTLSADTKFSDFNIGKLDVMTLSTGYDDDYIGFVRDLDVTSNFSDVEVRSLEEKIVADFDYGELKVKEVDQNFKLIDIQNSFSDANIGINPNASFKLVATIKMGNFTYPKDKARLSIVDLSYTSNKYEGVIGDNSETSARVLIETKNGGCNLYYR